MNAFRRDIVVFGEDWGKLPSSTQHLVTQLAKTRNVIWVNSIGLRQPTFTKKDIFRCLHKLIGKPIEIATKNIVENSRSGTGLKFRIVNPKVLPAPKTRLGRWFTRKLMVSQLLPLIKSTVDGGPILWISLPTAVDFIGHLSEHAVLYYCCDDFGSLVGVDNKTVVTRENELIKRSQLIVVTSKTLEYKFPDKKTKLLEHGVNYNLFSEPKHIACDLPYGGSPIAGFYGSISQWIDFDMLLETIEILPHWKFVFIGEVSCDVKKIKDKSNVYFLGKKPHVKLPEYSQHWSASLLPFKKCKQIDCCNPLKLREYLATGTPIVSTDFPATDEYKHLIYTAKNAKEMAYYLEKSLSDCRKSLRKMSVKRTSWENRSHQISYWLDQL